MDQALKKEEIPAGGIADFVMTDEQIEQLEAEELKEQFGTNGIAQFSDVGKKMANFGRYGDDTVAHVETGELIVPRALIEKNPELKESIFKHLKELGVEDPERYVVGESKNSVNPTTGLPEFFFKKIFKSVSKIAKGVGKALKKAAPLIIPMALNYFAPGLGQVYSAALGAGIGTLVQGGSVKDAFRSAVLGGATGAVTAGFSGPRSGLDGFGQNVMSDVSYGTQNISEAFSSGSFKPLTDSALPSLRDLAASDSTTADTASNEFVSRRDASSGFEGAGMKPVGSKIPPKEETVFDKIGNYMFRGGKDAGTIAAEQELAKSNAIKKYLTSAKADNLIVSSPAVQKAALAAGDAAFKAAGTSTIAKYGPSLALATAAGAAGGFFDAPEEEELEPTRTGLDVYNENPDFYRIQDLAVRRPVGPFVSPSDYKFKEEYIPYTFPKAPFQTAAEGGEIFPRRVGGIMPNEGIPNKDSVRAMLMPGEFVMTTDAVKGLGNGDMNKGINNMYGVMRNLEQRGKAMA